MSLSVAFITKLILPNVSVDDDGDPTTKLNDCSLAKNIFNKY